MTYDESAPGYFRTLERKGNRTLVKSTCDNCGFEIIDSVPDIIDKEWEHRRQCKQPKAAKAYAIPSLLPLRFATSVHRTAIDTSDSIRHTPSASATIHHRNSNTMRL